MLIVGVDGMILLLNVVSLERMADALMFDQIHNDSITSFMLNKNGKYLFCVIIK